MHRTALKFLCYVALALQVLGVGGVARGVTICTHSDGESRLESAAELAECHANQQSDGVGVVDRACIDIPIAPNDSTHRATNSRIAALEAMQFASAIPALFHSFISNLSPKPRVALLTELSRMVPDGERDSLQTVILVI